VEGIQHKEKLALTLQELLQLEGRDEEVEPYRKYLHEQSLSD